MSGGEASAKAERDPPPCATPSVRRRLRTKRYSVAARSGCLCTTFDDALEDEPRQRMLPCLDRIIGTIDDGLDETRSWIALDWLIRVYAPTRLDAAGLLHAESG